MGANSLNSVVPPSPVVGPEAEQKPVAEEAKNPKDTVSLAEATKAGVVQAEQDNKQPDLLLLCLLCAVSALEGADTALLPAAMKALQEDVGLKLTDLAWLNVAQAVCTNIAAPLWGILADRGTLSRRSILIIGALGQGAVTVLLAFVTVMGPMIFLRALNGVMLAALRPISNGIIADVTSETHRGKIFGRVQASLLLGMFITTMTAVPMSSQTVLGFDGWRVAFVLIGSLSVVVSGLVIAFLVEPPRQEQESVSTAKGFRVVLEEIKHLLHFFRIPTFGVMIMQGIFGTIPWSVMGNMVLFFQLSGVPDGKAAVLSGESTVTGIIGNLLGGVVADSLARRFGLHGRPLNAQITVALGIPSIWLIFMGVPPGKGDFWVYFALIACFGILGSWAQSGTNFPILSAIVPARSRSRVMAWECALENSIANALGPPVVALLATECFGYKFGEDEKNGNGIESAEALGKAMVAVICFPWMICFAAYSLLHWSYPRDVRRLEQQRKNEQQKQDSAEVLSEEASEEEVKEANHVPASAVVVDEVEVVTVEI